MMESIVSGNSRQFWEHFWANAKENYVLNTVEKISWFCTQINKSQLESIAQWLIAKSWIPEQRLDKHRMPLRDIIVHRGNPTLVVSLWSQCDLQGDCFYGALIVLGGHGFKNNVCSPGGVAHWVGVSTCTPKINKQTHKQTNR